ncbi:MAG: response regulator [Lachnospiraceae bacterium]|nr:response regulator [Lachnospiraceae bacterium]
MYKVVIIDDEEIIVRGITKMLHWEKWEATVAGSAGDGEKGLELIRKIKPDMVITDINMPRMDGLTMIAALKSEFPNMQIMILTGYRDFDYAREALFLGVTRLLVKPSRMDELNEAIDCMYRNLKAIEAEGAKEEKEESASSPSSEYEAEFEEGQDDNARGFIVKKAMEYMYKNYNKRLRLEDVAEHVYVSQWHLSKLLNKNTGQNFSEIINEVRIEKAKEFLRNPEFRIGDIAEKVGFLDMAHFSRVFKKCTGMSPSEYRNDLK